MKYNIELLKGDIEDELKKLTRLQQDFDKIKDKLSLPADKVSSYDRGGIGYILHNFYNGCENIFLLIARFFENDIGPQTWHRDLLKRMKIEITGFRPQVIDESLFTQLDEFRAFRHKFRHSYTFELDWERERLVASKLHNTLNMLQSQIKHFLSQLKTLEND